MYSFSDILKSFLNLECTKTGNQKENQEKILMRHQTKSSFKKLLLRPAEVVKKLRNFYADLYHRKKGESIEEEKKFTERKKMSLAEQIA